MQVKIDCTKEQLLMILDAIEVNFRILMNQPTLANSIISTSFWCNPDKKEQMVHYDDAEKVLRAYCEIIDGDYRSEVVPDAHRLSDMWAVIRHAIYVHDHEFADWMDVRSDKPIQLGDLPMIKVDIDGE